MILLNHTIFFPRVISRLPGGPGNASIVNPTDLSVRLTTPLAQ